MLFPLFFLTGTVVLSKGISQPKIRTAAKSVGQIQLIGNFLKFDIDITGYFLREKPLMKTGWAEAV